MRCSADRWSVTICSSFDSSKHCLVLCQARYHTAPAAWCHYHQVTSPRGTAKWDPDLYWDKNNFSRGSGGIELYLLKSTLGMPKTFISMCGLLKKQKQKSNSSRSQLNMQQTNTDVSKKMKLSRKKTSLWDSYFLHLKAHFLNSYLTTSPRTFFLFTQYTWGFLIIALHQSQLSELTHQRYTHSKEDKACGTCRRQPERMSLCV